jgi:hypothetical protein
VLAVALLSLVAVPSASASSAPRAQRVGSMDTVALVGDSAHTIAYVPAVGSVAIVRTDADTVTIATPHGCGLVDAEGSTVLFGCRPAPPNEPQGQRIPLLYDADAGTYRYPPGLATSDFATAISGETDEGSQSVAVSAVGRRWIEGRISGIGHEASQYDYATYLARSPFVAPKTFTTDATHVEDLDLVARTRALCAPLSVPNVPYTDEESGSILRPAPYVYAKPWALTQDVKNRPVLQRCGRRRTTRVRCGACIGLTLAGHSLAWADGRLLVVRDLSRGRTRHWRLPTAVSPNNQLALTRDAVFVAIYGTLYRADLR